MTAAPAKNFFGLMQQTARSKSRDEVIRALTVVIAPNSLVGQWKDEFKRYAPSVPVASYYGAGKERALTSSLESGRNSSTPAVIITSSNTALGPLLKGQLIHRLIVDESHVRISGSKQRIRFAPCYHAPSSAHQSSLRAPCRCTSMAGRASVTSAPTSCGA